MKRVLLKLSGEALSGKNGELYDNNFVDGVAAALLTSQKEGTEIAVVVGAGNIWRGRQGGEMDRATADHMGMLATVINALCLKDAVVRAGGSATVMTAIPMSPFTTPYSAEEAIRILEEYLSLADKKHMERNQRMSIPNNSIMKNGKIKGGDVK